MAIEELAVGDGLARLLECAVASQVLSRAFANVFDIFKQLQDLVGLVVA